MRRKNILMGQTAPIAMITVTIIMIVIKTTNTMMTNIRT
jgi:hypothetical protein